MAAVMIEVSEAWDLPIPRPILEEAGLKPGKAVEVIVEGEKIILKPYEQLSAVQAAEENEPSAEVIADEKAERKEAYRERSEDG